MGGGRYGVITGNPPYGEYSQVRQSYALSNDKHTNCGNLYAAVIERSLALCCSSQRYLGLIVPLSICGGIRFGALRAALTNQTAALWLANFQIFPSRLFSDAYQRKPIMIAKSASTRPCALYVTKIQRWYASERPHLINQITYTPTQRKVRPDVFPKLASPLQETILEKVLQKSVGVSIGHTLSTQQTENFV